MSAPVLVVEDLVTRFATERGTVHAVEGVSLELRAGETLGIVGESGSGKSVLARSIMGLLPTTAESTGSIRLGDRELTSLRAGQLRALWGNEIAMVFQDPATALNPVMRIGRQITESLRTHLGLDKAAARTRAIELLGHVGIPEPQRRFRNYPHELSGGMRQRVCIAIAIACSPKVLLADEPTTALDVTIQRQILDLLARLQAEGDMAMVLISHDLGVVARRADRIIVMYGGRVVEAGPTAAVFADTRHQYTAALLRSIPRLDRPRDEALDQLPGRPVDVIDPMAGCRFAGRCRHAQERCVTTDPTLEPAAAAGHGFACFYPVGSVEAADALERNLAAGTTAAGLRLTEEDAA